MIRPCDKHIDCPPDSVLTNYSSEAFALNEFFGIAYGANGCIERCTSLISQEDADLCAQRQLVLCENQDDEQDGGEEDFVPFPNDPQECTVQCPNGTSFTYVVPAGTFIAATLEEANAQALSYACQQAPLKLLCLGPVQRCCCFGESFLETVLATGEQRALTFEVLSGSLPAGIGLVGGDMAFQLAGTPTAGGNFTFEIRATDDVGNHADSTYLLSVLKIDDGPLPDFEVGQPYSHQLTTTGGSGNFAWRVVEGDLPPGLTLSLSGLISGTPTGGASGTIKFECIDLTCEATNATFFPPRIALSTASTTSIATVKGYPEFPGFTSSPPKRYKKLTWSGESEQVATWLGSLEGVSYNGVNCARAKYEWEGSGEINNAGQQVSFYQKRFYQACPDATKWPRNVSVIPNFGFLFLKGYCWPDDPNSCGECADPPEFSANVQANHISDFSDFIGGSSFTAADSTHAGNHTTRSGVVLLSGPVNAPTTEINDQNGPWVRATGTHDFDAELSEEYTDAIALANAVSWVSNGSTAETTPRTTGLVSRFTSVAYQLNCTNLVVGEQYTARVRLYNTKTGVTAVRTYNFTAADVTHVITDTIPTPAAGQPVRVQNPTIAFTP